MLSCVPEFDDESLIRIFVQSRRVNLDHANILMSMVQAKTEYKLPDSFKNKETERNVPMLKHILSNLLLKEKERVTESELQNRLMNIWYHVVAPTTIVYFDTRTNIPISYEEYESRYYRHLGMKSYRDRVKNDASISFYEAVSTSLSPTLLQQTPTGGAKRQRNQ